MSTTASRIYNPWVFLGIALLLSVAGLAALLTLGIKGAVIILAIIIGLPIVILSFNSSKFALYTGIAVGSFMFVIQRITGLYNAPLGLITDLVFLLSAVGVFWHKRSFRKDFLNPVTIAYFITAIYYIIQVANPAARGIQAWLVLGVRSIVSDVSLLIVCYFAIKSIADVKHLIYTFLAIAFLAGLYGVYQEIVGLPDFDLRWISADEMRYKLTHIGGRFRKWSFFSNVSSYGVMMAYFSLVSIVLCLGDIRKRVRIVLLLGTMLMLMGMGYSGTRTAYVMVPIGFAFYALLTINRPSTLIASAVGAFGLVFILFGPVSGGTISRLRTAFEPTEDASYQVREIKIARLRPYLWSHPMGGGIGSTLQGQKYHPGHPLAGFSPDSGYLFVGLEKGWIGLILLLVQNFVILSIGAKTYFRLQNPRLKNYLAAMLTAFFAICVGHISQNALGYLPASIFHVVAIVCIFLFPQLDKFQNDYETISSTDD